MNTSDWIRALGIGGTLSAGLFAWELYDSIVRVGELREVAGTFVEAERARGGVYPGVRVGQEAFFCHRHVCLIRGSHPYRGRPAIALVDRHGKVHSLRVDNELVLDPKSLKTANETLAAMLGVSGLMILASITLVFARHKRGQRE